MVAKEEEKKEGGFSQEECVLGLSKLSPSAGSRHRKKIVGRGEGSGSGKTSGRGGKGQSARSGYSLPAGFEGGQMPLYRRLPKFGFTSRKKVRGENVFSIVSTSRLAELNIDGEISIKMLSDRGLVSSKSKKVKILAGEGELANKVVVQAHAVSAKAKELIEKAGGEVHLLP